MHYPISASEEWSMIRQLVLPRPYRAEVLKTAHEIPLGSQMSPKPITKLADTIIGQESNVMQPNIAKHVTLAK